MPLLGKRLEEARHRAERLLDIPVGGRADAVLGRRRDASSSADACRDRQRCDSPICASASHPPFAAPSGDIRLACMGRIVVACAALPLRPNAPWLHGPFGPVVPCARKRRRRGARRQVELEQDVGDVALDRVLAEPESAAIAALLMPSAIRLSTSLSRAVSAAGSAVLAWARQAGSRCCSDTTCDQRQRLVQLVERDRARHRRNAGRSRPPDRRPAAKRGCRRARHGRRSARHARRQPATGGPRDLDLADMHALARLRCRCPAPPRAARPRSARPAPARRSATISSRHACRPTRPPCRPTSSRQVSWKRWLRSLHMRSPSRAVS